MEFFTHNFINGLLLAQAAPQPSFSEVLMKMLPMFVMVIFIFYIMVVRPQNQKVKSQQELLKGLKRGDGVVLSSGILGKFVSFDGEVVIVEISANTKVRMEPSAVAGKEAVKDASNEKK